MFRIFGVIMALLFVCPHVAGAQTDVKCYKDSVRQLASHVLGIGKKGQMDSPLKIGGHLAPKKMGMLRYDSQYAVGSLRTRNVVVPFERLGDFKRYLEIKKDGSSALGITICVYLKRKSMSYHHEHFELIDRIMATLPASPSKASKKFYFMKKVNKVPQHKDLLGIVVLSPASYVRKINYELRTRTIKKNGKTIQIRNHKMTRPK